MTESEKQQIISLVLQALKTNSLAIEQLTSIDELPDDAYIEISNGCKISCSDLKKQFKSYLPGVDIVCSYGNRVDAVICQDFFTKELQKIKNVCVFLTEQEYEALVKSGKVDPDSIYLTFEED